MIPEKRVPLLIEAFALAHAQRPDLRLQIFGKGPERGVVAERIAGLGLGAAVTLADFVEQRELDAAMAGAIAIVQPSIREGYGMVVVEANARGVPAIVVEAEDNAAAELVKPGANGEIAQATASSLAQAILRIAAQPEAYRASTRTWFMQNRQRLSVETSMDEMIARCGLSRLPH
jgi:glycosyltransferase involved in cell wall biosynthesis